MEELKRKVARLLKDYRTGDCMLSIHDYHRLLDLCDEAFNLGLEQGQAVEAEATDEAVARGEGWNDGYEAGFKEGYDKAYTDLEPFYTNQMLDREQEAREKGFAAGFAEGLAEGRD